MVGAVIPNYNGKGIYLRKRTKTELHFKCLQCKQNIPNIRYKRKVSFCSKTCYAAWRRTNNKDLPTFVCRNCKKTFSVRRAKDRSVVRQFCSRTCAHDALRKLPPCRHSKTATSGPCKNCYTKIWKRNNPLHKNKQRSWTLQQKYGISIEQWNAMFDRQNGLCPICEKPLYKPDNAAGRRAAAVDHDHKTGRVRGLTCSNCNRYAIAKNTLETAKRLVTYLASEFDARGESKRT